MEVKIPGTLYTPEVFVNEGSMHVEGRLIPHDNYSIFDELISSLNNMSTITHGTLKSIFRLSLINASSKKNLIFVLKQLEKLCASGKKIYINWQYDSEDEEIYELGVLYKSMFNLEFNLENVN